MRKSEMIKILCERMMYKEVNEPEKFMNEVLDICLEFGMVPPSYDKDCLHGIFASCPNCPDANERYYKYSKWEPESNFTPTTDEDLNSVYHKNMGGYIDHAVKLARRGKNDKR